MAEYKTYPTYKDSKIQWLGEIPEHWMEMRINNFTEVVSEKNHPSEELLSVYRDFGVIIKSSREDNHNKAGEDLKSYKLVKPGYLVLNKMKTWQGSLGVSYFRGIVSPAYITCKIKKDIFENRFLHHLLRSHNYIFEYNRLSYGVRTDQWDMRYDDFKNITIFVPPLSEQTAIANFLDRRTREIAGFIALKEKTIALLKERKTTIINKAVTKGLDDTAPMKDSGIEWLGKIPAHWEVKKLKYLLKLVTSGGTPSMENPSFWDGDILWISPKDMKSKWICSSQLKISQKALNNTNLKLLPKGTLLLVVRSGILQRTLPVAITSSEVTINQDLKAIVPKSDINSEYFFNLLKGCESAILHQCVKAVATVESIEMNYFMNFLLPLCTNEVEQCELVKFINEESLKFDQSIAQAEKEISLIKEYQQNLISEAVTGKIDVRNEIKVVMPVNLAAEGEVAYQALTQR